MNKRDMEDWSRFILALSGRARIGFDSHGYTAAHDALKLRRIAIELDRLAVRHCNGYQDDASEQRDASRRVKILEKAQTIANTWPNPANVYHQGDPRGLQIYLCFPDDIPEGKSMDSYYNNGLAVPQ